MKIMVFCSEKIINKVVKRGTEMKISIFLVVLLAWSISALADDSNFSTHLYSKFQTKGCIKCHDFFEKERGGWLSRAIRDDLLTSACFAICRM